MERVAVERLPGVDALGAENWQPVHDEALQALAVAVPEWESGAAEKQVEISKLTEQLAEARKGPRPLPKSCGLHGTR